MAAECFHCNKLHYESRLMIYTMELSLYALTVVEYIDTLDSALHCCIFTFSMFFAFDIIPLPLVMIAIFAWMWSKCEQSAYES